VSLDNYLLQKVGSFAQLVSMICSLDKILNSCLGSERSSQLEDIIAF